MDENVAKALRELDNVVFEMYEKDVLTLEQYDQILRQTIDVRISVKNLSQYIVSGMWYDYDDIDNLPHGEYKVRTNFSNEKIGEFFNEEWLDAKNSFDTGELVLEYYR